MLKKRDGCEMRHSRCRLADTAAGPRAATTMPKSAICQGACKAAGVWDSGFWREEVQTLGGMPRRSLSGGGLLGFFLGPDSVHYLDLGNGMET